MLNPVFPGVSTRAVGSKNTTVRAEIRFLGACGIPETGLQSMANRTKAPRGVKIVASIGPASNQSDVLEAMILAGADVFRIDFGKGSHETHAETIVRIRTVAGKLEKEGRLDHPVRIMADLQGPRIAVGKTRNRRHIHLAENETIKLTPHSGAAAKDGIPVAYPDLLKAVRPGNRLIFNDGAAVLEVTEPADSATGEVACKVLKPGVIKSGMTINAPDTILQTPPLTEKDQADLRFALAQGIEIITQSFPASDADVRFTRELIEAHDREAGTRTELIAKIERPQAVEPRMLAAITRAADGVMVARGDLGTEMGVENLPELQQRIIDEARRQGKTSVVANKLLGSLMTREQSERSDVFDLVHAVQNGADMIMMTGETSSGKYPVLAVEVADRLIRRHAPARLPGDRGNGDPLGGALALLRQAAHALADYLFDRLGRLLESFRQAPPNRQAD